MRNWSEMIGKKYGQQTILDVLPSSQRKGEKFFVCKCDCGTVKQIRAANVINGQSRSCGRHRVHGDSKRGEYHRLYQIWADMKNRCSSPNNHAYNRYGGRGITVCDEWSEYLPFKQWALSHGYCNDLTIDRIDVNGNYCPENCRWATYSEQNANQTNTPRYEYNGETHTLREWSTITGISQKALKKRIYKLKWPIEKALTQEMKRYAKRIDA